MVAGYYVLSDDPGQAAIRSNLMGDLEKAFRVALQLEDQAQKEALVRDIGTAKQSHQNTRGGDRYFSPDWVDEDKFNREKTNIAANIEDAFRIAGQINDPAKRDLLTADLAAARENLDAMTWDVVWKKLIL